MILCCFFGRFSQVSQLLLTSIVATSPDAYNLFLTLIVAPLVIQGLDSCFALQLDNFLWVRVC